MKIAACPFCGKTPTGKKFCSSECGPSLICDHCRAEGPPALGDEIQEGTNDRLLRPKAILRWNSRAADMGYYRQGIEAAAEYVEMFDRRVQHHALLSDCIRAKFNLPGHRKPRKNPYFKDGAQPKTRLEIGLIRAALLWHAVKVFKRYPNAGEDKAVRRAAIALLKGQPNDKFEYPKKGGRAR